uniref:Leukocyte cysteine proteinase inhibitor 1-like n=1 Tax=Fundulus heteroclitus TaxID=8078 RepID=A0A3Q2UDZ0_FUNHE
MESTPPNYNFLCESRQQRKGGGLHLFFVLSKCRPMWNQSERKTDRRYKEFNAVEYRSQVVAGYNYVIKVQVGGNDYVHLMIFQSLVHDDKITIEFLGVRGGYKREDPLVPF